MPTLCFDGNFNATERRILSKTFRKNCRDLGIADHDATIELRRLPIGPAGRLGCISKFAPDRYVVLLNTLNCMMENIFALGHETVHLHQYVRGDMVDSQASQEVIWKGQRFRATPLALEMNYERLPWEIEAASKHHKLLSSAGAVLDADERRSVLKEAAAYEAKHDRNSNAADWRMAA